MYSGSFAKQEAHQRYGKGKYVGDMGMYGKFETSAFRKYAAFKLLQEEGIRLGFRMHVSSRSGGKASKGAAPEDVALSVDHICNDRQSGATKGYWWADLWDLVEQEIECTKESMLAA